MNLLRFSWLPLILAFVVVPARADEPAKPATEEKLFEVEAVKDIRDRAGAVKRWLRDRRHRIEDVNAVMRLKLMAERKLGALLAETDLRLERIAFLHAPEEIMPTWWTQHPVRAPLWTGWAGGPKADALSALDGKELERRALASLASALPRVLETTYRPGPASCTPMSPPLNIPLPQQSRMMTVHRATDWAMNSLIRTLLTAVRSSRSDRVFRPQRKSWLRSSSSPCPL